MAVPVARRRGWVVVKAAGGLTAVAARGSGGAVRWTSSGPGAAVGGRSGGSRTHCGGSRAAVKVAERWCRVEVKASDGPMTVAAGGSAGAGGWPSSGPGANEGGRLGGSRAAGGLGAVAAGRWGQVVVLAVGIVGWPVRAGGGRTRWVTVRAAVVMSQGGGWRLASGRQLVVRRGRRRPR
jgi:hypothetical protein